MRRKTRLYLLLLLVLVGLPVGLIGGAWWYVGSGQLRVRIESAWDLPGRLQVGSVRLVGPDSLLITDIAIHAADGQLLASCAEARVSDGLWRADPGLIAARDWMVLADATALVAWRNLLEAIRRRPVTDGAVMPRLDLQEGLLRLPGGSLPGLSIQHDVDSTSLQSADGLQVRGSATPTGRLWRWQAGSVPVMDLLLAVHQLGLLPDPDPHLLLFVPVQVDGTGSELQWQGPERWRLDLQATWAGSGACVLQAERTQGRLSLEPRTLAHGHLPGLRMQDGDLFLRHRDTEALVLSDPVLRLQGLPAMRTAVLEAAVGGRALPLRAEWARHDDRLVVQLPQAGVDAADLSTWIGLWTSPPAWLTLPPVLHLDGSRYEIQEQGASASIALHWAGGDALVQGRERTSGAWRWRLASASGSDLPDGVHVQDGRWHLGHDLVLPSVLVDWHADAVRAQIGLAADRALQLERQGDAVVITDGSLPLDRLLRWVADWGWLPLPPAALLEWTGTGLDPVGSRLDWSAGLQVAARARGQDWSLEALARPQGQAGGWSLDDLSVQHRHLGRLDGALELTAAGQQLSWDELGFGPGLARLVDLPLDWPAVGRAVAAGGLSHADGAITVQATTTAGGQLQLHSAAGNGRLVAGALPAGLAGGFLPETVQVVDGRIDSLALQWDDALQLDGAWSAADLRIGGMPVQGLDGRIALRTTDGLHLELELPGGTRIAWQEPAATAGSLDLQSGDLAALGEHLPADWPALSGRIHLRTAVLSYPEGLRGRIEELRLTDAGSTGHLDGLDLSASGVWHADADGFDWDLSGQVQDGRIPLGSGAIDLGQLQPILRSEGSLHPQRLQIHGLLLQASDARGAMDPDRLSIGASGTLDWGGGASTVQAVIDHLDLAWVGEHLQGIGLPAGLTAEDEVALVLSGRLRHQGIEQLEGHILPMGNSIRLRDPDIRIEGLRGALRLLITTSQEEDGHETTDE